MYRELLADGTRTPDGRNLAQGDGLALAASPNGLPTSLPGNSSPARPGLSELHWLQEGGTVTFDFAARLERTYWAGRVGAWPFARLRLFEDAT